MSIDLTDLRLQLAIIKHVDGVDHVKSRHLTDRVDASAKQIGQAMIELRENGDVEKVAGDTAAATWKITLDGGPL